MILEALEKKTRFTETDKAIADYLLNNDITISLTSSKLAQLSHTSQSAVIRLANKVGKETYRSFLHACIEEKEDRKKSKATDLEKPFNAKLRANDAKQTLGSIYQTVKKQSDDSINDQILDRLYNYCKDAKWIDVYGVGISGLFARQLVYDLQSVGLPIRFIEGSNDHYMKSIQMPQGTVVLIYSFTGNNPLLIEIAKKLKDQGITTFGFIGRKYSELEMVCDHSILFCSDYYEVLDNLSFEYSAMYLNHILYSMFVSE